MKRSMKLLTLAAAMAVGMAFQAVGQEGTPVTSVSLTFSWDTAPRGGEQVGKIYAASSSRQFVVEGAEYVKRDDAWTFGEQPIVEVELSAEDGYYFSSSSKNSISLSGCNAQYRSSEIDSDGSVMILRAALSRLDGSLPGTTSVSWSGDSSSYLNLAGDYTFNVRAIGDYSTQHSSWSASSEPNSISIEEAWTIEGGSWQKLGSRWRYVYANGAYPTSTWRQIGDVWYYFNYDGYMVSNCYVKSLTGEMYYWINGAGAWDTQWDTAVPERGYNIYS